MLLADHADGLQKKYMRVINLLAHIISKKTSIYQQYNKFLCCRCYPALGVRAGCHAPHRASELSLPGPSEPC
ncbi:hypothetical protein PO609_24205, partial [Enterobacter cloacae]|uniref:hypothetical protein n=1 Tax=Enterobacter cloacae TaxID=550 RepID=UPI002FF646C2